MARKNPSFGDGDCEGDDDRPRSGLISPKLKKPPDLPAKKISGGAIWRRKSEAGVGIRSSDLSSRTLDNASPNLRLRGMESASAMHLNDGAIFSPCSPNVFTALENPLFVENQKTMTSKNHEKLKKPSYWAALFKEAQVFEDLPKGKILDEKLKRIQNSSENMVDIEDELIDMIKGAWINSLYGKFYGNSPSLNLVQQVMPRIWKTRGSVQVIDMAAGYFCFKFTCAEDRNRVLTEGPWFFRGQALLLTPWRPNFQPLLEKIDSIPVWIQLPGLPIEYLQKDILLKIVSCIGHPIKIDSVTLNGQRAKFARVCMLWNLKDRIPSALDKMKEKDIEMADGNEHLTSSLNMTGQAELNKPVTLAHRHPEIASGKDKASENLFNSNKKQTSENSNDTCKDIAFKTGNKEPVIIQIGVEKCLESFHRKLTDTLAIKVNEIKDGISKENDDMDEDLISSPNVNAGTIRKPTSQYIHIDSFPLNIRQNRSKKKKFSKDEGLEEYEGDPSSSKQKGKQAITLK
ncbi:hypothetical protein Cni_G20123 [Canna indica]|uniref:DUF4283 domain-containing protein n=1 Tax=Canna indica TaxID=4628 RepID=A0AAQ3QFX2_9LILI|nr:hypothetical protein Cni_G20123 [Canna indica]